MKIYFSILIAAALTCTAMSLISNWLAGNTSKPEGTQPVDMNVALLRLPLSDVDEAIEWTLVHVPQRLRKVIDFESTSAVLCSRYTIEIQIPAKSRSALSR